MPDKEDILRDNEISLTEAQNDVEIIETIDVIEVEHIEPYQVLTDVAFPATGEPNEALKHQLLNGRELDDQHPISAITGLRNELNEIERLKVVYSDKVNIANYYEWEDGKSYDTYGYFVSLVPNTSTIKICDGGDILGVSVETAGFIGGQDGSIPRAEAYGLITTSGLVDIRCELDVEVGDYVTSNDFGYAKKSDSNYGYKVLALETKNGVEYAIIMLGVQADVTNTLGVELSEVKERVDVNETNIVSAINVANQAYNKAQEAETSSSISEEAVKEALESIINSEEKIKEFEQALGNVSSTSAQAKAIAESAVTSAESLKDEAINRANDAWAKADKVETEVYSLCAKIDKYSVGEYSQAYGLTLEQAQSILEIGMIYVPTKHIDSETHKEEYEYKKDGITQTYAREFIPGYLYQWDYIANEDINIGWLTVGESPSVYFSSIEPTINDRLAYWYTDSDIITDINGKTDIYEPYTLYKWEEDHWLAVATLKGNASNRMVSEIYHTTNQITMGVANPRGCIAAIDARVTDTESDVSSLAAWRRGDDSEKSSESIIKQTSNDDGASVTISAYQRNLDGTVENTASLVLNSSATDPSALVLNADNILFTSTADYGSITLDASQIILSGTTTFDSLLVDGKTTINGGSIEANTITVDQINVDSILVDSILVEGESQIQTLITDTIDATSITADSISVYNTNNKLLFSAGNNAVTIGGWTVDSNSLYHGSSFSSSDAFVCSTGSTAGFIIGERTEKISGLVFKAGDNFGVTSAGKLYCSNADIIGKIVTNEGKIGGWTVDNIGLWYGTGETADDADILLQPNGNSYGYQIAGQITDDWRLKIGDGFGVTSTGALACTEGYFGHGTKDVRYVWLSQGSITMRTTPQAVEGTTGDIYYPLLEFRDYDEITEQEVPYTLVARKFAEGSYVTWNLEVISKRIDDFMMTV